MTGVGSSTFVPKRVAMSRMNFQAVVRWPEARRTTSAEKVKYKVLNTQKVVSS